jgi:uncharacterized protein (DUF2147 family)
MYPLLTLMRWEASEMARWIWAAALVCTVAAGSAADAQQETTGRWITASGNLEVEIAPCGAALCGTVVRVIANRSMAASGAEMKPADTRPALGMTILYDFAPTGGAEWKGHIYNRENGEAYDCLMLRIGPDELKIRPYRVIPLFGQTQIWHRAAATSG